MRVGLVTKWFNRGQPVVGRQLRSALDELGHETHVLARPKKERGPRPGALQRDDVWDQPGITEASAYDVPGAEYEAWVEANGIEVVLCDQNYQFDELASLRRRGVKTIGRFVWEHFTEEHVAGAREAFDLVYSFTRAEQERYRSFGLETPYVAWGCHPELIAVVSGREGGVAAGRDDAAVVGGREDESPATSGPEVRLLGDSSRPRSAESEDRPVRFLFPGGFLGHRKPLGAVLEAFERTSDPRFRLVVKAQVERKQVRPAIDAAARDARIEVRVEDLPTEEHLREIASFDACLALARWEGLGLPLYEAIAFGQPVITNDAPPMNEPIHHGVNGILVGGHVDGAAKSGIPAIEPDIEELAAAIERLGDDRARAELAAGAIRVRDTERRWESTVAGIGELVERVAGS